MTLNSVPSPVQPARTSDPSPAPDPAQSVSAILYRSIATLHQMRSDLLSEKYRAIDWQHPQRQAELTKAITGALATATDADQQRQKIEKLIHRLFAPSFAQSHACEVLVQHIRQLLQPQTLPIVEPPAIESPPAPALEERSQVEPIERDQSQSEPASESFNEPDQPSPQNSDRGVAALLLDVENLKLQLDEEAFLQQHCPYPLSVKIAFGNWRSVGRYDIEFFKRGYQMIHVPAGGNAADMQMTAVGASLFLHHPQLRAAIVCSSDNHLIALCNLMQTQGLQVYFTQKRSGQLSVIQYLTNSIRTFGTLKPSPRNELEQRLMLLIQEMTVDSPGGCVSISTLSQRYKLTYGTSVSDFLKASNLQAQYLKFLKSCASFRLQQEEQIWQIGLKGNYL